MTNFTTGELSLMSVDSLHYDEFSYALMAAGIDYSLLTLTPGPTGAKFAVDADYAEFATKLAEELDTIIVTMICTKRKAATVKSAPGIIVREQAFFGLRRLTLTGPAAKVYSAAS